MNQNERRTQLLKQAISEATPEAPTAAWICPECKTDRSAGEFFCAHDDEALSRDLRPRIAKRA